MKLQDTAAALQRVESIFLHRPAIALHAEAPATSRWEGGMRVVTTDAAGASVTTDMPIEFGGSGDQLTSGWLLRAALASCLATRIAMTAAVEGIELDSLEVHTRSQSDARGLMGLSETDGRAVPTEPREFELLVNIVAKGVSPERLRALVKTSESLSPVSEAMRHAVPVTVRVPPESE